MAEISRTALFGKLNKLAYQAIESATVFCKMRGNPYVELVHWFHQILQLQDSDLHRIIRRFDIDNAHLARDLTQALDSLPRGATSISDLSSHVESAVERGWVYGSLMFGEAQVRTGYLLVGILKTTSLRNNLLQMSQAFQAITPDVLTNEFDSVVVQSPEQGKLPTDGFKLPHADAGAQEQAAPAQLGKQEALQRYSIDLTELARKGDLDPIVGRDHEIRQIIDVLMRRRQNNPILTGEAGVGKTAVVEGLALRIAAADVPPALAEVSIRTLDIGLLEAGASMKGEFEDRLRQVIEEVQSSPRPIVLFVDEAHTLIGAGGTAGTGDAANLLKPALARGTLRTVAATTWSEYKKHIDGDAALRRRFQVIPIEEPGEHQAISMMRAVAPVLEGHHGIEILNEALESAVRLSHRYIPARQLPDKAVSLLDTASSRVATSLHATPAQVEDSRRRIEMMKMELQIIEREKSTGIVDQQRESRVRAELEVEEERLSRLENRWKSEKSVVAAMLELRAILRREDAGVDDPVGDQAAKAVDAVANESASRPPVAAPDDESALSSSGDDDADLDKLQDLQAKLERLQGEAPLVLPLVDEQAVASVVADWTGVPVGKMVRNEIEAILNLTSALEQRVIGQSHALEMISKRVQTSRAALDNPDKPIGVFLLAGPSGVGKTETALALAEALYGGEQNVITINMSEFQEAHTVSTLKGSPPGYVGYGEGGVLTEAVRRKPYSVILLDEVEKAHSDVHELFFQVFDKGVMDDAEGRRIDFKNTLILLTSNVGTDLIVSMCSDPELLPDPGGLAEALRQPLLRKFPAALLGRLVAIPYYPLSESTIKEITHLQLARIARRIEENHGIPLECDDAVVQLVVSRCQAVESGGRMIDAILTNTLLPEISAELLRRMIDREPAARVVVSAQDGEFTYSFN